jgi:hypothetical protein
LRLLTARPGRHNRMVGSIFVTKNTPDTKNAVDAVHLKP